MIDFQLVREQRDEMLKRGFKEGTEIQWIWGGETQDNSVQFDDMLHVASEEFAHPFFLLCST